MKVPRLHVGEGAGALAALAMGLLLVAGFDAALGDDMSFAAAAWTASGAVALALVVGVLHGRRRAAARPADARLPERVDDDWFTGPTFEGFPAEAVRPLLERPGSPSRSEVCTAWVLATHGHDADWITGHLDLPPEVARVLVEAALQRD
ncbi:hypothetical protein LKL35_18305 [Streptomyces sp. ET3-23]|uniref:hypothetical protein n=1 Tax=Streptomyces sp. ET3-23 TaxID=2885643 RepID=UPI001D110054|nr:hypothetical protein [Streptomyces sp. ET3-23]MCC2277356.1 hypothetical protein [Streptomyces sp. ET3-23]